MIKKVFIILFLQVVLYSIFVKVIDLSWVNHQTFEQSNLIKSDNYIYEEKGLENKSVFVGTSLSAVLSKTNLPNRFINLAFHGMSALDGLRLINSNEVKPKEVFVEMNMVLLIKNDKYYKDLQSPFDHYRKKYLPILRQKARPVELTSSALFEFAPEIYRNITNQPKPIKTDDIVIENAMKAAQIESKKNAYAKIPDAELMDTCFEKLANQLKLLEETGVCIIFYEIPLEEGLCGLIQSNEIRNRFYKEYPPEKYQYIPQPHCTGYKTTDGLHLTVKSAKKFTAYFLEQVNRIKC